MSNTELFHKTCKNKGGGMRERDPSKLACFYIETILRNFAGLTKTIWLSCTSSRPSWHNRLSVRDNVSGVTDIRDAITCLGIDKSTSVRSFILSGIFSNK